MIKVVRRLFTAVTVSLLAFRAIGSFLSWIEAQENSPAESWLDDSEFEDA